MKFQNFILIAICKPQEAEVEEVIIFGLKVPLGSMLSIYTDEDKKTRVSGVDPCINALKTIKIEQIQVEEAKLLLNRAFPSCSFMSDGLVSFLNGKTIETFQEELTGSENKDLIAKLKKAMIAGCVDFLSKDVDLVNEWILTKTGAVLAKTEHLIWAHICSSNHKGEELYQCLDQVSNSSDVLLKKLISKLSDSILTEMPASQIKEHITPAEEPKIQECYQNPYFIILASISASLFMISIILAISLCIRPKKKKYAKF